MVKTKIITWDATDRTPLINGFQKNVSVKAFIQARQGSTRLPNKIYEDINGAPMLWHVINKAKRAKLIDEVVVISPTALPELPDVKGFAWDGPEMDVLGRYYAALKEYPCDYVVRITSDCPLLDPNLIDYVIKEGIDSDYCSNVLTCTFPDGLDVELISAPTLQAINEFAKTPFDREHVTTYIRSDPFVQSGMDIVSIQSLKDYSDIKVSVDTQEDLEYVRRVDRDLCLSK